MIHRRYMYIFDAKLLHTCIHCIHGYFMIDLFKFVVGVALNKRSYCRRKSKSIPTTGTCLASANLTFSYVKSHIWWMFLLIWVRSGDYVIMFWPNFLGLVICVVQYEVFHLKQRLQSMENRASTTPRKPFHVQWGDVCLKLLIPLNSMCTYIWTNESPLVVLLEGSKSESNLF